MQGVFSIAGGLPAAGAGHGFDISYTVIGDPMNELRLKILLVCCSLAGFGVDSLMAQEVYRWVDENGVVNFSDTAPAAAPEDIDTLVLVDSRPSGYDAEEDIYDVTAQAARMAALREEMAAEREARRERQREAPPQPPVQYEQGVRYGYPFGFPAHGRPPGKPPGRPPGGGRPPRPEPYETSTLLPPGQQQRGGQ
jgi:hypothetical protein